jgi:hypothetical protein
MVLCFSFFVGLFDFGYCSLVQEKSFVDGYLAYFRQWLTAHLLLALLPLKMFVY